MPSTTTARQTSESSLLPSLPADVEPATEVPDDIHQPRDDRARCDDEAGVCDNIRITIPPTGAPQIEHWRSAED